MKAAIVYDRVNKWGGAEKVLLVLHEIFPDAPLYTAVYDSQKALWARMFPRVIPSFLQKIPFMQDKHEFMGMLTPIAFESFNFDQYDLIISVTSEAAKGIVTKPATTHICICLTPTRYLWSGYDEYLNNPPSMLSWIPFYKLVSKPFLNYAKYWDKIACKRPDKYVAISTEVRNRIKKYYYAESKIIFPPVDVDFFDKSDIKPHKEPDGYYLYFSRLIPYKKPDLAIEAFNTLGKKLVVVGMGSEEKKLKKMARDNIKFIRYLTSEKLSAYFKGAKALIFPGEEDFGIVMVEALASGTPVIAYGKGGALDIVQDGRTGVLFNEQTVDGVISAVEKSGKLKYDKNNLVKSVQKFSKKRFQEEILDLINT